MCWTQWTMWHSTCCVTHGLRKMIQFRYQTRGDHCQSERHGRTLPNPAFMFEGPKGTCSERLSPGDFLLAVLPLKAEDQFWLPSAYANGTQVFEHRVWHRLRHSQNLLGIKVATVATSQGDISEKPCCVEWQIHSAWSLLPWPSPTSRSPEEYGKHVFEESFKLFYIPICSSI